MPTTSIYIIGLAVLLTLCIVIILLLKIKKQQAALYKPELYFDGFDAEVFNIPITMGAEVQFEYRRHRLNYLNDPLKQFDTECKISLPYQLKNMGMGTAKSVAAKWHFDREAVQKNLEALLPESFELELLDETLWLKNTDPALYDYMDFDDLNKGHFEYILPTAKGIDSREEAFPKCILNSYLYNFIFTKDLHEDRFTTVYYYDFEGLPKPILELNYTDINNKRYKNRFEFSLSIINPVEDEETRKEIDGRLQLGILSFEVKEI